MSFSEFFIFNFRDHQRYGIDVLKIREIIKSYEINEIPGANGNVIGMIEFRGRTLSVFDFYGIINNENNSKLNKEDFYFIIIECNKELYAISVNGVEGIEKITNDSMDEVPYAIGENHYLSYVSKNEKGLIQLLDFEKFLKKMLN